MKLSFNLIRFYTKIITFIRKIIPKKKLQRLYEYLRHQNPQFFREVIK